MRGHAVDFDLLWHRDQHVLGGTSAAACHAIYGGEEALLEIESGRLIAGALSRRTRRLVQEWIELRLAALLENWRRAESLVALERIRGLGDADPDQDS